jgi:regulator of replication initiation timing
MTIPEMYSKIESNEKKIEDMFDPTTFVLVEEAHALLKENEKLKKECAKLGAPYEKKENA